MRSRVVVATYRLLFAALAIAAIGTQFAHLLRVHGSPVNFFSFFTIESNIFAAAVLIYGAPHRPEPTTERHDLLRGAATTYMTVTGVVYALLLSDLAPGTDSTISWVNWVLHRIFPIVTFADWLIVPPTHRLSVKRALVWAVFPFVYAVYALTRGAIVHWYPYPFLNVDEHGLGRVLLTCLGIAVGAFVFIWAIVALGNLMRRDPHVRPG
jgi:hypothetical protein